VIRVLAKLQSIDRRWLYLATLIFMLVPFIVTVPMPPGKTSPTTRGIYDAIESCPPDKVILVDSSWHQGYAAENYAQFEAVIRHLCLRHIKFVVTSVGIEPIAPEVAEKVITPIAEKAGYVYGRDWVNAGYLAAGAPGGASSPLGIIIEGVCRDFHKLYPTDVHGTPIEALPLMEKVRGIQDVHMVFCVTYCPDPQWIQVVKGQFGVPVGFACMTIMAPSYYTFIDSGQLCGMLIGNRGAAEYEDLVDFRGRGTKLIMAASFGNCCIILAGIIGNIGLWAAHRRRESRP